MLPGLTEMDNPNHVAVQYDLFLRNPFVQQQMRSAMLATPGMTQEQFMNALIMAASTRQPMSAVAMSQTPGHLPAAQGTEAAAVGDGAASASGDTQARSVANTHTTTEDPSEGDHGFAESGEPAISNIDTIPLPDEADDADRLQEAELTEFTQAAFQRRSAVRTPQSTEQETRPIWNRVRVAFAISCVHPHGQLCVLSNHARCL